jgi:putative NADPH-quinone reductase
MNILAVLANDKNPSLDRFFFARMVKFLEEQGHQVTVLDLYQKFHDLPFYVQQRQGTSITKTMLQDYLFFHENKELFLKAEMLVICCPVHCFCMPGILKAWFDIVAPVALQNRNCRFSGPLHRIQNSFVVATMGMSWFYKVFVAKNCLKRTFKNIFSYINVKHSVVHEITSVDRIMPSDAELEIQKILKKLHRLC